MYTGWKTSLDIPITLALHTYTYINKDTHTHICVQCLSYLVSHIFKGEKFLSLDKTKKKLSWNETDLKNEWWTEKGKRETGGKEKSLWHLCNSFCFSVWCAKHAEGRKALLIRLLLIHISWQFLFFQWYTNITTQRLSKPGGVVRLVGEVATVSLCVCVGWVRSGCIVSGCLCNLDVRRKNKFSIEMWSDAIKTLVYSLVCFFFGQHYFR